MRKLNLYEFEVKLTRWPGGRSRTEDHVLYVAARSGRNAVIKASNRLNEAPHGIGPQYWRMKSYRMLGKVFL